MVKEKEDSLSVYGEAPKAHKIERHVLSVLVDNEPGVLSRIVGLFSGRGYNIESLTVAEVSKKLNQSRMTIVVAGTSNVIEQIIHLLARLVPVHKVTDLTELGPNIERELLIIKMAGTPKKMAEALSVAEQYNAEILDETPESYVFQVVAKPSDVDAFLKAVKPLGMKNISRTGSAAMSRGKDKF